MTGRQAYLQKEQPKERNLQRSDHLMFTGVVPLQPSNKYIGRADMVENYNIRAYSSPDSDWQYAASFSLCA